MSTRNLVVIVLASLAVLLASDAVYTVKETQRSVLLRFGALAQADIEPGIHFKLPLADDVKIFDGRMLTLDSPEERFFTKEKKPLIVDAYVKWQIREVDRYYRATSGEELNAQRRLEERVKTGLRAKISTREMQEVVSGEREELMEELTQELDVAMLEEFGVHVRDVRVKRIELPPEVSSSVFQRMNAEREVLARELRASGREQALGIRADADRQAVVIRSEAERESEQVRGEGDANAASIYANAYNADPEFYEFTRSLTAYRRAFSSKDDVLVIDPSSDFFRYLGNRSGGED
ncbi:MAG: protease modulator HflC [Pseudomonadales bacterium]|jgi:membrane protease subunit HflC|nr:protease modulator HflC [Pseudomonadales bacterium]